MTRSGGFPSRFERPADSPGFLLWQVTNSWQREIRRALKGIGLTHVQFVLLTATDWLSEAKLPTTQTNVAKSAHTDVMMTSEVVRTLKRKGLMVVEVSPSDTRAHTLRVTPKGRQLVKRALELVEYADGAFFGPLSGDSTRFVEMLSLLSRSYAQGREQDPSDAKDSWRAFRSSRATSPRRAAPGGS
jgi:MarR family transcriptional regulator, organic hydroperoxide resistance regulator